MIFCTNFEILDSKSAESGISQEEIFNMHVSSQGTDIGRLILKEYPPEDVTMFRGYFHPSKRYETRLIACRSRDWNNFKQELYNIVNEKLSTYEFEKICALLHTIENK